MALPAIQLNAAPLLWSDVAAAFEQINDNFSNIDTSISILGGGEVSLSTVGSNLVPSISNKFLLGTTANRWKSIYTSAWTTSDQSNGIWIGSAQIKGSLGSIDLPNNSTVNGVLINLPAFKMISAVNVDSTGGNEIVASAASEIATFEGGHGIRLTVDNATNTISVANTVHEILTAGPGIDLTTTNGITTIKSTGVNNLISGGGIGISVDVNTGLYTITNTAPIVPFFRTINVPTKPSILADIQSDVLTLVAGTGIGIDTDAASDTITINVKRNVQELSGLATGNVTLTAFTLTGDILTGLPLVSNRVLKLPNAITALAGKDIVVANRSATFSLTVTDTADTIITVLTGNASAAHIVCDGFNWYSL